ncbi:MAG: nicotinamide-nucleotide amidohydrolase family protein [Polyangia bacterium]
MSETSKPGPGDGAGAPIQAARAVPSETARAARLRGEIVTIGDELNRGEIIDSNAAWLGEQLTELGIHVRYRQGVNDQPDDIAAALRLAAARSDVVLVSGGLGPTSDDLTVDVAAQLCGVEPVVDPEHEQRMRDRFTERKLPFSPNNLRQVRVPQGATVLPNHHGLAPGFLIGAGLIGAGLTGAGLTGAGLTGAGLTGADLLGAAGPIGAGRGPGAARLFFMPGVPREQRPMFLAEIAPRLRAQGGQHVASRRRVYRVIGLGESQVDHRLQGLAELVPAGAGGVTVHYRLAFPEVLVTLVAEGTAGGDGDSAQAVLDRLHPEVLRRLGRAVYSETADELQVVLGRELHQRGATLVTAESCTGGLIGQILTSTRGSSAYYQGGVIAYANEVKVALLGVRPETIAAHGAVSEACVREMAEGARRRLSATYAISVSGIAGPDGGTPDKPVGTVHLAAAGPDETLHHKLLWPGDREQIRRIAAVAALNLLHKLLNPERRADTGLRI